MGYISLTKFSNGWGIDMELLAARHYYSEPDAPGHVLVINGWVIEYFRSAFRLGIYPHHDEQLGKSWVIAVGWYWIGVTEE